MKRLGSYWVLAKFIFALALGFMLGLAFLVMGPNVQFFSKDNDFLWAGIIICTLSLYLICYALVGKKTYLLLNLLLGFMIAEFAAFFDVFEKVALDVWYEHNEPIKPIPFKQPEITPNFQKCKEWKYGTFHSGIDTITRFSKENIDYEVINNEYQGKAIRIEWIDDCSYYKWRDTGQLLSKVNMGDFKYDKCSIHYFYLDQSGYPKTISIQKIAKAP